MVDKKYINTTIEEDLLLVEQTYSNVVKGNIEDKLAELPLVDVVTKKPGYDDINGKYINQGAVVFGKVSSRGKNSRSGEAFGYKIDRVLCDSEGNVVYDSNYKPTIIETKLVTKDQAIHLTQFMGSLNSYIRSQDFLDDTGNIIKKSIYLRPIPAKTQAFFLDGRVINVYKTDEYGNRQNPIALNVTKDECTIKMWSLIQNDFMYKSSREKPKQNILESRKENEKKIHDLKKSLINNNQALVNPFGNNNN